MMMDFLDNEYKKRFKNQEETPKDLDIEALWNDIAEGLDNPKAPVSTFRFFKKGWFWGGALLLLFIIGLGYLQSSKTTQKNLTQQLTKTNTLLNETNETNKTDNISNNISSNDLATFNKVATNTTTPLFNNNTPANSSNTKAFSNKNEAKNNNNKAKYSNDGALSSVGEAKSFTNGANYFNDAAQSRNNEAKSFTAEANSFKEAVFSSNVEVQQSKIEPKSILNEALDSNKAAMYTNDSIYNHNMALKVSNPDSANAYNEPILSINAQQRIFDEIVPISTIISNVHTQLNTSISLPKLAVIGNRTTQKNTPKSSKLTWQGNVVVGTNLTKINYTSSKYSALATQKNQAEHLQLGTTTALNIGVAMKKHWTIGTGFAYNQLWSKFEVTQQKSSTELKQNQLLKVWIDTQTGRVLKELYGDTAITTVTTRTVRHYNRFEQYSIPLHIGYQTHSGKFTYGISSGVALNFVTSQTGKRFDTNGNIITFNASDANTPFKKQSFGFYLGATVGYEWHKHWNIILTPIWQYQQHRTTEFTTHIHQFNGSIGLRYTY